MELDLNDRDDVGKSLRKKIENRIAESLKILRGRDIGDSAVHDARRQFKQIRSALRMLRKSMGEKQFAKENRAFRDAGRPLSAVRDAKVMIDALDGLLDHFTGRVKRGHSTGCDGRCRRAAAMSAARRFSRTRP